MSEPQALLLFLLILGVAATGLRLASRWTAQLPYQVILALGGLALGLVPGLPIPHIGPDLILLVFVPGLIFEAAIALDLGELRAMVTPVALLATLGVAGTVVGLGLALHLVLDLSLPSGFVIGAIVAATDPIAVVSLLRRVAAPAGLKAILEGESLFNDGTGVAVFSAVVASVLSGSPSLTDAGLRLLLLTAGGTLVGLAVGTAAVSLLRREEEAELEILGTLLAAYASYLAADLLHFSGVVAVVAAGMVVARFGRRSGRLHGRQLLGFWRTFGFVMNAVLFVLIGTASPIAQLVRLAPMVAVGAGVMLVVRAVPVYLLLALADPRASRVPWAWRHLVMWGGVRGALGVALALSVAGRSGIDPRVSTIAYGMIIVSLLVQGGLIHPIAAWLGLSGPAVAHSAPRTG